MGKQVDVCLVEMPFSSYATPVYSLSLLKGCLDQAQIHSEVIYGNMLFSGYSGLTDYLMILYKASQKLLLGEAAFVCEAYDLPYSALEAYFSQLRNEEKLTNKRFIDLCIESLSRVHQIVPDFLKELSEQILAKKPRIVAMSSMFYQNNACIALARYLKMRNPKLVILMGGANCTGTAGSALVRNIRWLDFVFSGEADECFADLCKLLLKFGTDVADSLLPYGTMSKTMHFTGDYPVRYTKDLDKMSFPNYDDFFASLQKYNLVQEVNVALFMEFSRGCWWNAKKPCTFCGLNARNNTYRIKSTKRILCELFELYKKYKVHKFSLTDNILSPVHLKELLPKLIEADNKFLFFAEVKSNLTKEQLHLLSQAGFKILQPGIENLQDDILIEMNKGNRGIKHIELLKNAHNEGIRIVWHMLGGFPNEKPTYYEELAQILPYITHLEVPKQFIHILYNRYSAYVNSPKDYGLAIEPYRFYPSVYPLGAKFVEEVAFMYQPVDCSLWDIYEYLPNKSSAHQKVRDLITKWQQMGNYGGDRLTYKEELETLELTDLRVVAKKNFYSLKGVKKEVYQLCDSVRKHTEIFEMLSVKYTLDQITDAIDYLKAHYLLLEIKEELLALAVQEDSEKLIKPIEIPPGIYCKMMKRRTN